MFQRVEIENFNGEKVPVSLKEILEGFPINSFELESI